MIGVYEPLVLLTEGLAHRTSRAEDPQLGAVAADACFHVACYALKTADDQHAPALTRSE